MGSWLIHLIRARCSLIPSKSAVEISPNGLNDADLRFYLPLLCANKLEDSGNKLTIDDADSLWQAWNKANQKPKKISRDEQVTWHDRFWSRCSNYEHIGGAAAAVIHSETLVELQPSNGEWNARLGMDLADTGNWTEALKNLTEALRLGVENVDVIDYQIRGFLELGRLKDAEKTLALATKTVDDKRQVATWRRLVAGRCCKWQEVVNTVNAIEKPLSAEELFDRGTANAELGNLDKAKDDFSEAAKLAPDSRWLEMAIAHCELGLGNKEQFAKSCERILKKYDRLSAAQLSMVSPDELREVA